MTSNLIQAIGSIATACGVFLALWQLHQTAAAARTGFEDDLDREYREIARKLPKDTFLNREVTIDGEDKEIFKDFWAYFDLSNQQVFLRQCHRVTKRTWRFWRDGIQSNISRPGFREAWKTIKADSNSFSELRRLEANFDDDPCKWRV
jgi:hypothetical protein